MFAARLKTLRKSQNLSQIEFAKLLSVSSGAVAMWETEKREPDKEMLIRLADFFGVTVDYLLGRDNTPTLNLSAQEQQLYELLKSMTDDEIDELTNFVEYILSKRK